MMRIAIVCGALGSALVLAGCGGSSSSDSSNTGGTGAGGSGQASGGASSAGASSAGASQTSGGTGQASGGTGDTTGGSFTTSVPATAVLGSLSDTDANTLCMDLTNSAAYASINDFACRVGGILAALTATDTTDAGLQAACKTAYDSCTADAGSIMCNSKPTAACMATVGEYEACLNDEVAEVKAAQIPQCADLKAATIDATLAGLPSDTEPASCTTVDQKCPEFAGSDM